MEAYMDFLHEITGNISSLIAYALAASGLVIYFFRYVRKYAQIDRKLIVKIHLIMTLIMIVPVLAHIFTTDKSNFFVYFSVLLFVPVAILGLSLRVSKVKTKAYKKVIIAKIVILLIVAASLTLGHTLLENKRKDHSSVNLPSQEVAAHPQVSVSL